MPCIIADIPSSLWPIPLYGTSYIFSKQFFTGWIVVTFIWGFFGAITITLLPLWESRREILLFIRAVLGGGIVNREADASHAVVETVDNSDDRKA